MGLTKIQNKNITKVFNAQPMQTVLATHDGSHKGKYLQVKTVSNKYS